MMDLTFAKAVAQAEALKALGKTDVYLASYTEDEKNFPWSLVTKVEAGGSYRLNGPVGARCVAPHPSGLTFTWSFDFEWPRANGASRSQFNRAYLREIMDRLPGSARKEFAQFLVAEVLPGLEKNTAEWRTALNEQLDSEDCVRGLVAYAKATP